MSQLIAPILNVRDSHLGITHTLLKHMGTAQLNYIDYHNHYSHPEINQATLLWWLNSVNLDHKQECYKKT